MTLVVRFRVHKQEVEDYFIYAGYKARDLREPFEEVADMTLHLVHEQFVSEGERLGTPWLPLNSGYLLEKELHYPGRPKLVRTGAMKADATDRALSVVVTKDSFTYRPRRVVSDGTDIVGVHMSGREPIGINKKTGEPYGEMPARPIFRDTVDWYNEIEDIFYRWLDNLRTHNRARFGVADLPLPPAPNFVL